jgi:hypothetical protein
MTNPPERMTRRDHLLDQDVGEHEPLRSCYTRIIDWASWPILAEVFGFSANFQ